jgi:hypothetical protein
VTVHVDLWLEGPADRREVRDFFYDATKCDRYLTGPHSVARGRPDRSEREHYAVFNDHGIIDLNDRRFPEWDWPELPTNTHVWFTLNDGGKAEQWLDETIVASIHWLASHPGDLLLAAFEVPILARKAGDLLVNSDAQERLASHALSNERAAEVIKLVTEMLKDRGASYRLTQLPGI